MSSTQITADSPIRVCPACGQTDGLNRGLKNDFQLLACSSCATLYAPCLPKTKPSEDYDSYYTLENLNVPAFIDTRLDEIVSTFEAYRKNNRLLDVGCGAGTFLEAAKRDGWQVSGVEVSRKAAEHVGNLGFEVFWGELENAGYPDNYFDVVILSEVIEHVHNPRSLVEEGARVLRPGGLLWGTTPHGRGISARLLGLEWSVISPPEHLQLFSVSGVKGLLTSVGLSDIKVATHGTNPFELICGLRGRATGAASQVTGQHCEQVETFNRVESSYQLNEKLSGRTPGRFLKATLNKLLNATRMGDSLKIRAEKSDKAT